MSLEFTQPLMNVFGLQGFHIKSNFSCKFGVTERVGALLNAAERALCRRRRRIPAFALPVKFRMLVQGSAKRWFPGCVNVNEGQAEVVSNSSNEIHQTLEPPFSRALY